MLLVFCILIALCCASELAHEPHTSSCATNRDGHEDTSLLQNRVNPKAKSHRVGPTATMHFEPQPGAAPAMPRFSSVSLASANTTKLRATATLAFSSAQQAVYSKLMLLKFQYQKYNPHAADSLLMKMIKLLTLGALFFAALICCCRLGVRRQSMPPMAQFPHASMSPSPRRTNLSPMLSQKQAPSPPPPTPSATKSSLSVPSPVAPRTGSRASLPASTYGLRSNCLHADLVLPQDKEVLLAVPSLSMAMQLGASLEYPISNKDGSSILLMNICRRREADAVCEVVGISMLDDSHNIAFCKLWPEKVRMNSAKDMCDALVGAIFNSTGELYANIIRVTFATSSANLPVGDFIVKSAAGQPWQLILQSKGNHLIVVDMDGRPHGSVMSGIDLSFKKDNVQYYQLHGMAGTDLALLLLMVMSIDRLTLLSKG